MADQRRRTLHFSTHAAPSRHTVPPLMPHRKPLQEHHHRAPQPTLTAENLLAQTQSVCCEHSFWPPQYCGKCEEQAHNRTLALAFLSQIGMRGAENLLVEVGTDAIFHAMDALAGTYDEGGHTSVKNPPGFVRWTIEAERQAHG